MGFENRGRSNDLAENYLDYLRIASGLVVPEDGGELPTVTITQPTSEDTYHIEEDSITVGGTASDNVGITSVTWVNNRGDRGTASGTGNWTIPGIPLYCGEDNIIIVTAEDAAGNSGTDPLTIDVKPCPVSGIH